MGKVQHHMELIKLEDFARRMQVSRTTVFEWMKKGKLLPGKHFIKVGRVIRFSWGPDLLAKMHEADEKPPRPLSTRLKDRNRKVAINLNY